MSTATSSVAAGQGSPSGESSQSGTLGDAGARGTGITLAVQAARAVLQFGSIVALARLLTPEDFGLVAMVAAIIGIADLIRDFGLSLATMRAPSLSAGERTNLFWANLGLGFACTVVAIAATPLIVAGYGEQRLAPIVFALATVFTISGFTTQFRAGLARDMRFKALGAVDITAQVISIAAGVGLAVLGFGVWALVASQIANAVVGAVMCVALGGWWPAWPRRDVSIRSFLSFGGGVFGTQSITYVTKNIDNVAIGAALGATPLGLYSRAYQLMIMPIKQIDGPLTQVALPVLGRVQHEDGTFVRYLTKAQLVACYITANIFAVAIGLATPIILLLFGEDWLEIVPIFMALAVGGIFRSVGQVAWWAYLARGASGALLRQRLVVGPLVVALILGGLHWGVVGVAVGQSVGAFLAWLIAVWHVGRVTQLNTRPLITNAARTLLLVAVPVGAAAYLGTLLDVPTLLQIAAGTTFAALYLAAAWLVVPFVRADLGFTLSFGWRALGLRSRRPAPAAAQPA